MNKMIQPQLNRHQSIISVTLLGAECIATPQILWWEGRGVAMK